MATIIVLVVGGWVGLGLGLGSCRYKTVGLRLGPALSALGYVEARVELGLTLGVFAPGGGSELQPSLGETCGRVGLPVLVRSPDIVS